MQRPPSPAPCRQSGSDARTHLRRLDPTCNASRSWSSTSRESRRAGRTRPISTSLSDVHRLVNCTHAAAVHAVVSPRNRDEGGIPNGSQAISEFTIQPDRCDEFVRLFESLVATCRVHTRGRLPQSHHLRGRRRPGQGGRDQRMGVSRRARGDDAKRGHECVAPPFELLAAAPTATVVAQLHQMVVRLVGSQLQGSSAQRKPR
jgi:hypothetical protein